MEDWQRQAYEAVAAARAEREVWTDEDVEQARALGGFPAVIVDPQEGCPDVAEPGRWGTEGVDGRGARCGTLIKKGKFAGTHCRQPAGQGTYHRGAGHCVAHGGAKQRGRAEAAWMVAHAFAGELDCSPWEALLKAVRIAAKRVAYTDWVMSQATNDLELEGRLARGEDGVLVHPDTQEPMGVGNLRDLSWWVAQNTLWVDRLARYGKMAIDAGVSERLVQQVELEGQALGRVLTAALTELEGVIDEEHMGRVRGAMRAELMAIEQEQERIQPSRQPDGLVVDSTYVDGERDAQR